MVSQNVHSPKSTLPTTGTDPPVDGRVRYIRTYSVNVFPSHFFTHYLFSRKAKNHLKQVSNLFGSCFKFRRSRQPLCNSIHQNLRQNIFFYKSKTEITSIMRLFEALFGISKHDTLCSLHFHRNKTLHLLHYIQSVKKKKEVNILFLV